MKPIPKRLPTLFLGFGFDDGWEFDRPYIIYSPCLLYGEGGNSGKLYSMVESHCIDISAGDFDPTILARNFDTDTAWRNWDIKQLQKENEIHSFSVEWGLDEDYSLTFEITPNQDA